MICAYREGSADWEEGSEFEFLGMMERRESEIAGPSNRELPAQVGTCYRVTSFAVKLPGESWNEPVFERFDNRKGTERLECMIQTESDPSMYLAGYFMEWTQNEAHLRIPVQDEGDTYEWVNLKSSRLWRGDSAYKHWTHIAKGLWKPKAQKGKRPKKKQKAAPTEEPARPASRYSDAVGESEERQDTDNVYSGRQGSLNTMSTSLAMRPSTAQEEGSGEATEDPEISKLTEARETTAAEMSAETAQAIVEQRRRSAETSQRFAQFVKGHFVRLKEKNQIDASWVKGCNWESGNTEALRRNNNEEQEKAEIDGSSSAEIAEKDKLKLSGHANLRGRSRDVKVSDGTLNKQQSPRSTSPSTPNKAERGNSRQQQNSSSEDCENRATHASPTLENAFKPGRTSVASPRSIGNGTKQAKASRGNQDLKEADHEQNSGSSSSSGKAMQDLSPDTVLLDGPSKPNGISKSKKGCNTQEAAKPPVNGNGHVKVQQKNGARKASANLPAKKRMKVALVELDPFSMA